MTLATELWLIYFKKRIQIVKMIHGAKSKKRNNLERTNLTFLINDLKDWLFVILLLAVRCFLFPVFRYENQLSLKNWKDCINHDHLFHLCLPRQVCLIFTFSPPPYRDTSKYFLLLLPFETSLSFYFPITLFLTFWAISYPLGLILPSMTYHYS